MSARGRIRAALGLPTEDPTDAQIRDAMRHRHNVFEWDDGRLRCSICGERIGAQS